jgi:hypothetical protein
MLKNNENRYFDIIREDVFTNSGELVYNDYVTEFEPYAVGNKQKKYANFGAIELLDFGMKSGINEHKDRKFHKKYIKAQTIISETLFNTSPILETEVSEELGYDFLNPRLRNLTYGDTELSVWVVDEYTYVLVNAGKGESSCNLLFFCRIAEPKKVRRRRKRR